MKLLVLLALVLLLEVACCQSNRPTRPGGKPAKKTGTQGATVPRTPPAEEDSPAAPGGGAGRAAGGAGAGAAAAEGPVEAASEAQPGGPVVGQQSEDMRLQFLRNLQVTCNDGTAAGYGALDLTSMPLTSVFQKHTFVVDIKTRTCENKLFVLEIDFRMEYI